MQLPPTFTAKIPLVFGEKGRAWLEQLPQIIGRCQERWQLTNIRVAEGLSYNLICFADSPAYGPVVLKIGVPNPELSTEMKALSLYAGGAMCALYDADMDLGALLLERVVPGDDLRSVTDNEERFRIAAGLFATLPVAPPADDHGFPTYRGWISRAFARTRAASQVDPELLRLLDVAERCFDEIDTPDRPHLLLHGDLHHMNILRDERGGWKVIDPKGVIGVACMGAARFMLNEFHMGAQSSRLERFWQMTAMFAAELGETEQIMAKCAFVELVLATCWDVEEHMPPEALRTAVSECAALYDALRQERGRPS